MNFFFFLLYFSLQLAVRGGRVCSFVKLTDNSHTSYRLSAVCLFRYFLLKHFVRDRVASSNYTGAHAVSKPVTFILFLYFHSSIFLGRVRHRGT